MGSQRGLTVVELLIGVAIGLFIVSGLSSVFVTHLHASRRLLTEARVNQDLRVAADLIARDLRRAAYWGHALGGTALPADQPSPPRNPYQTITPNPAASSITYALSRDPVENDTLDSNEQFGFRLNTTDHTLQMRTASGTWQAVTDPGVMTLPNDGLALTALETPVDLRDACARACTGTACPSLTVRSYRLTLKARATADARVVRRLDTRVRVRNDRLAGACPS